MWKDKLKIFKSKKVLGLLLGILILAVIVGNYLHNKHNQVAPITTKASTQAVLLSPSDITEVKVEDVEETIPYTGNLEPLEKVVISSQVSGLVSKVLVKAGDLVKKGQTLAIIDDSELKQNLLDQEASYLKSKSQLSLEENKLQKQKALYDKGFISKIGYAELENSYKSALEAYHQELAKLNIQKQKLAYSNVKAPFNGYIYQKNIELGQFLSTNSNLFAIANLDFLQLIATIPNNEINRIKVGQKATFKVEGESAVYKGYVNRINPVAVNGTSSYEVYINFDNRHAFLKAGQFVKGQIAIGGLNQVSSISTDAIHLTESPYVLVVVDNKVVAKPINILLQNKFNNISAISGLNPYDKVILEQVVGVKAGDTINIESD